MYTKIFFTLIIFTCSHLVYCQNISELDPYFDNIDNNSYGIGSIEITKNGALLYKRDFGNIDYRIKNYHVGSITKTLTAVMIYQLFEIGKLKSDETINRYFPDVPNSKKITISHLLNHSSGLKNYNVKEDSLFLWLTDKVSEDEIFSEIIKQGTAFEPGENVDYSNSGYYLLARLLEKIYNEKYTDILNDKIIVPLKLKDTKTDLGEECIFSYKFDNNNNWEKILDFWFPNISGIGNVVSNPHEINKIMHAIFTSQLINYKSLSNMKPSGNEIKFEFGKGLMKFPFEKKVFYGHEGHTLGTHSIVLYDEKDKVSITLCLNGQNKPMNEIAVNVLCLLYNVKYNKQILSI